MTLLGVHHVNLRVHDLGAAVAFYRDALGLVPVDRPDMGNEGVWLAIGDQQLHLSAGGEQVTSKQHFAIAVDELDATVARLRAAGVDVDTPAHIAGAGRQAFVRDPSGNRVEFNQPDALSPRRACFLDAADVAGRLLSDPTVAEVWSEPSALPGMTIGTLAAHLGRAVLRVVDLLGEPVPDGGEPVDASGYYASFGPLDDRQSELNRGIVERATAEAAAGPDAVRAAYRSGLDHLRTRLLSEPAGRVVSAWGMPMVLDEYLSTRIVELAVHVDDLAASIGSGLAVPEAALEEATRVLAGVAVIRQGRVAVLRALSRRERDAHDALRVL